MKICNLEIKETKNIDINFDGIYSIGLPNDTLEKMLSNMILISYDQIFEGDEKQTIRDILFDFKNRKSGISTVDLIAGYFKNEVDCSKKLIDEVVKRTWYSDSNSRLILDVNSCYQIHTRMMMYFMDSNDLHMVMNDILLPLKLIC